MPLPAHVCPGGDAAALGDAPTRADSLTGGGGGASGAFDAFDGLSSFMGEEPLAKEETAPPQQRLEIRTAAVHVKVSGPRLAIAVQHAHTLLQQARVQF
jgi:hypothetical protein